MPRRRKTNLRVIKHPAPALPEGEESAQITEQQRKEKLELFLKDFDMEVENRVKEMRNQCKTACRAIDNMYRMEIFKLPKHIRNMTMTEFLEKGGSVDAVNKANLAAQDEAAATATTPGHPLSNITNSGGATTKHTVITKGKMIMETVPEEQENLTSDKNSTAKVKSIKRKKIVRKKAVVVNSPIRRSSRKRSASANASLTGAGRSTRKRSAAANATISGVGYSSKSVARKRITKTSQFITPARQATLNNAGWDTPAITPKFDPRLPYTPATTRKPKPNERLMSMDGSPVSSIFNIQIPLKGGKTMPVNLDDSVNLDQVDFTSDDTTRNNLLLLQTKLNKILQKTASGASHSD